MATYVVVLPLLPLLEIVLLGLELDDAVPQLLGFDAQLLCRQVVNVEGLDADGEGDFLLFFQLLLGLVALKLSVGEAELLEKNRVSSRKTQTCKLRDLLAFQVNYF